MRVWFFFNAKVLNPFKTTHNGCKKRTGRHIRLNESMRFEKNFYVKLVEVDSMDTDCNSSRSSLDLHRLEHDLL